MDDRKAFLAVLFADVAKSTQLYEKLGDSVAKALIARVLDQLSEAAASYQGRVIKTIGDEVMCTFPSADQAVSAARAMHESMEFIKAEGVAEAVNIHVGVHLGQVLLEKGDVFGDAVNVALRMVGMAKPRQIILTQEAMESLSPDLRKATGCADKTTIKGRSGVVRIYEYFWEGKDRTFVVDTLLDSRVFSFRLELSLEGQTLVLDKSNPGASLGRQPHNDLVVDDHRVSRTHARIEYRRGKYVLVDQSSNGTYLVAGQGKLTKIKRDEAALTGEGMIALGREPEADQPGIIKYRIVD